MGKSCCIKGCNVSSPNVEYFKFPRGGSLLAAWAAATGAAAGDVCAAHFTTDDYRSMRGKRRLLGTAVPSVFHNTEKPPSTTANRDVSPTDKTKKNKNIAKSKNKKGKKRIEKTKPVTDPGKTDESSIDIIEVTDNNVSTTDNDKTEEEAKIENGESSQDTTKTVSSEANGKDEKKLDDVQPEINDIEDLITNYQIKQTKPLAKRLNPDPLEEIIIPTIIEKQPKQIEVPVIQETSVAPSKLDVNQLASHLADKLDNQLAQIKATAPVFIEVAVDQDKTRAESPQDCLMLLESVQCDIDPSSLMLPEHGPETDSDMEIVECDTDTKIENPSAVSLLTSSDEDEVIIEEPHIDTVEVSDGSDEDDQPLQRLVRDKPKAIAKPAKPKKKSKYINSAPFVCVQCDFRTGSESEFKQHNLELTHLHSTTIQVCHTCNYSTASKAQFSRHKRKHKDERNFKCHLCNYKARHSMSLIYHLKSHDPVEKKQEKFTCDKCGFSSNVKSEALNHLKGKDCGGNKNSSDQCFYSSKTRSDVRRHQSRKHYLDDSDDDLGLF